MLLLNFVMVINMFKYNFLTLCVAISFFATPKAISQEVNYSDIQEVNYSDIQEVNYSDIQELILEIIDPNSSISTNIENLEKLNITCEQETNRKVECDYIDGIIKLSRRGRSTTEVKIPPVLFDIYSEDGISMLLDAVIEAIGETDYEMKSISGLVFI